MASTKIRSKNNIVNTIINETLLLLLKGKKEKKICIALFGSRLQELDKGGDVDLLIVLPNKADPKIRSKLAYLLDMYTKRLDIYEKREGLAYHETSLILSFLARKAGIFRNTFVCDEYSLKNRRFHDIFNVNRIFSSLFAPSSIVLKNISSNYRIFYGTCETLRNIARISVRTVDFAKAFILSLLLIIIFPFLYLVDKKSALQIYYEGIKWFYISILPSILHNVVNGATLLYILPSLSKKGIVGKNIAILYFYLRRKRYMLTYKNVLREYLSVIKEFIKVYSLALQFFAKESVLSASFKR